MPDLLWDALDETFGPVRTKSERGRRNSVVKELRDAGATPEQVRIAYEYCRRTFTTFTEKALTAHFSRALHEQTETSNVRDIFDRMREAR